MPDASADRGSLDALGAGRSARPANRGAQSAIRIPKSAIAKPNRESVTTINADGSRYFLYPADVRGRFTRWRQASAALLVAVYLLLPWIPVGGFPAVFLDVAHRRFHFFGLTLAAQDTWLLFFAVTGLGFSLFFLTALFGRLWCGWACPHTVFLDHVYRRIERWVEGDALRRKQRHEAPLSAAKVGRLALKHALYALASLGIAHLFLAYFVSLPELWHMMRSAPGEHWSAFVFVTAFAGLLHFNFAWFREQLCIVLCPYGRLQSALTDDHSLVIGYDERRGEPRGKRRPEAGRPEAGETGPLRPESRSFTAVRSPVSGLPSPPSVGDCIDCHRCVQVCPTGIDIRHGLQMECIGCAACVDACDEVMARIQRPRGLIRYDSLAGLSGGRTRWWRARTVLYGVLLLIGAAVATYAFSTVRPVAFSVVRMTGAAYYVDAASVRNQLLVRLLNKRAADATFVVSVESAAPEGVARSAGVPLAAAQSRRAEASATPSGLPAGVAVTGFEVPVTLAAMAEQVAPLVLRVDRARYTGPFSFTVRVRDAAGTFELAREVRFLGPDPRLLQEEDREKGLTR